MTEQEAYAAADEFAALVQKRIGVSPEELECPREKSDMTPCVARDGGTAVAFADGRPICVGCEADLATLLKDEKAKE